MNGLQPFLAVEFFIHKFLICSYVYEKKIHNKLLEGYNLDVRPEIAFDKPVRVVFDLVVEEINELDVRKQVLDVSTFITLKWNDPQLTWNVSEYGNIDHIVLGPHLVWTPDIVLYNTGEEGPPSSHREIYRTKINIFNDGAVKWVAPTNWKVSCSCDIKWFPVDSHVCAMNFGSWSYDYKRLALVKSPAMDDKSHVLGGYNGIASGEWSLTDISTSAINTTFRCCMHAFSTISIEVSLTRMPLYYLVYTLLPVVALMLIMALIFQLDIGQRATFGVTILLSISVFLLFLSEKLPHKSDDLPWVGISFIVEYLVLCLCLPLAEYTGHLTERTDTAPPRLLMRMMARFSGSFFTVRVRSSNRVGDKKTNIVVANGTIDHTVTGMVNGTLGIAPMSRCFNRQWRRVAGFIDNILTVTLVVVVLLVPMIIAAASKAHEKSPPSHEDLS